MKWAIIITRENCFKCDEIKEILENAGVKVSIIKFHQGGAELLIKKLEHLPRFLPTTVLYDSIDEPRSVLFIADGLSEFMEKWDEIGD